MASHFQNLLPPQELLTPPENCKQVIDVLLAIVKFGLNHRDLCAACMNLHKMYVDNVFLDPPAAGRPDPGGHGDLGERRRGLLPPAAGAVLQPRHAVCQRGLLLHRHRGRAGAAGAPGLLCGPQGEQVSAAHGRCKRPSLQRVNTSTEAS